MQTPSEACAHLFPFMVAGGEGSELSALYQQVGAAMMAIHEGRGDVGTLVRVAKSAPIGGSIDQRLAFRMMVWLVTYYTFFDKKVRTRVLYISYYPASNSTWQ